MNDILKAVSFSEHAHRGQVRKYTNDPYVTHCLEVAQIVQSVGGTDEMIVAALLHDTVEDTPTTIAQIEGDFGTIVATFVEYLTDCGHEIGNRAYRKLVDAKRLATAPPEVQTIKLADLISNTRTIVEYDPKFAVIYLAEKRQLLSMMRDGDQALYGRALQLSHCEGDTRC